MLRFVCWIKTFFFFSLSSPISVDLVVYKFILENCFQNMCLQNMDVCVCRVIALNICIYESQPPQASNNNTNHSHSNGNGQLS